MKRAYIFESAEHDWGDYWDILVNGMAFRGPDADEPLELERSGPFVPPITFPMSELIVDDECKRRLSISGLTGFEFRRVIKKKIVSINWHEWDWTAEDPRKYPSQGEPENYIDARKHSEKIASQLGDLWELIPVFIGSVIDRKTKTIKLGIDPAPDIFRINGYGYKFVNTHAKDWFEKNYGQWVGFREVTVIE